MAYFYRNRPIFQRYPIVSNFWNFFLYFQFNQDEILLTTICKNQTFHIYIKLYKIDYNSVPNFEVLGPTHNTEKAFQQQQDTIMKMFSQIRPLFIVVLFNSSCDVKICHEITRLTINLSRDRQQFVRCYTSYKPTTGDRIDQTNVKDNIFDLMEFGHIQIK